MALRIKCETVEDARRIAVSAHYGQVDKAGKDYILHPVILNDRFFDDDAKILCLLHDVIEDTSVKIDDLILPDRIRTALIAITHLPGEDYAVYIKRLAKSFLAVRVKLEDLVHNFQLARFQSFATDSNLFKTQTERKKMESVYNKIDIHMWAYKYLFEVYMNWRDTDENTERVCNE